jgi:hypothetical protein
MIVVYPQPALVWTVANELLVHWRWTLFAYLELQTLGLLLYDHWCRPQ